MALFGPKKRDRYSESSKSDSQQAQETIQEAKVDDTPTKAEDNSLVPIPKESALITDCMNTKGHMSGCGSLIIMGQHEGNISMKDTVVISEEGSLVGKVEASKIKISGNVKGILECEVLEITQGSKFEGEIYSHTAYINGEVSGEFYASQSIEIDLEGVATAKECKSKTIRVLGKLDGKVVASEMLEVINGGAIDGEIVTKGIKTMDGGSVVGTIVTYNEKIHSDKPEKSSQSEDDSKEPQGAQRDIDPKLGKIINADKIDVNKYAPKKDEEEES
jgi:cytoskeletal protein CcmA (bactofilin family)